MPDTWLNVATISASRIGRRYRAVKKGSCAASVSPRSEATTSPTTPAGSVAPTRRSTSSASSRRPRATSQRGLSGMPKVST